MDDYETISALFETCITQAQWMFMAHIPDWIICKDYQILFFVVGAGDGREVKAVSFMLF